MSLDDAVVRAREEVVGVLRRVRQSRDHQRLKLRGRAERLHGLVLQAKLSGDTRAVYTPLNGLIRSIHNFYGWKALGQAKSKGLCAGALYRSARYLQVDQDSRSGAKRSGQNVHIEHTTLVDALIAAVHRNADAHPAVDHLYTFLVNHSVCTAVHMSEKGALDPLPCTGITDEGEVGVHPFLRYLPAATADTDFRVVNVITGEWIRWHEFTFERHLATLEKAAEMATCERPTLRHPYRLE